MLSAPRAEACYTELAPRHAFWNLTSCAESESCNGQGCRATRFRSTTRGFATRGQATARAWNRHREQQRETKRNTPRGSNKQEGGMRHAWSVSSCLVGPMTSFSHGGRAPSVRNLSPFRPPSRNPVKCQHAFLKTLPKNKMTFICSKK